MGPERGPFRMHFCLKFLLLAAEDSFSKTAGLFRAKQEAGVVL
jgi:hypothetical protein